MSKPQVASEPTLEEILTSIRKMISDDKPGPSPMPDQMGRTPFGESLSRNTAQSEAAARARDAAPAGGGAAPSPGFNSLSDALKVATTLSDQRRSLQQEVASALEKTPRNNLDALTELSSARAEASRSLPEGRAQPTTEPTGPRFSNSDLSAAGGDTKQRDLMSFDFGTMVPQRDDLKGQSPAADAKSAAVPSPSPASPAIEVPAAKADAKTEPSADSRVLQLRSGLNGSSAQGLNGAAANVAAFPRPVRESAKTGDTEVSAPAAKTSETSAKRDAVTSQPETAAVSPAKTDTSTKSDGLGAHGEALLDAVVDLVQQQPSALSVFTSGASFIGGITGSKAPAKDAAPAAHKADAKSLPEAAAAAAPIDGAAAELLRPMLRQWLTENMGRLLEEALRSELGDKTKKGPGES